MEFTTHDNDNDAWSDGNCATGWDNAGNWWNWCGEQNMNGLYGQEDDSNLEFMTWGGFDNYQYHSLKTMKLMIRSAV